MDINDIRLTNLKRLITEKGFKDQTQFGKAVGKSRQQISNIMTGRDPFGAQLVSEFSIALNVDPKEFYKGIDTSGSFDIQTPAPTLEITSSEGKGEDTRSKVIGMVMNILKNGTPEQINALFSTAEILQQDVIEQKKAAPRVNIAGSEGRKAA